MAVVGEMHYLTIGNNTYSIPVSGGGGGTVTSVRVQATSPVQSSASGEQTVSLNTTISLADAYGDTKNPYGTKTANYILAGPTSGSAAAPTFRALTAADIPDLSSSYLPSSTTIPSKTSDLTNDSGFITSYTDEKLAISQINYNGNTYYPIIGTNTSAQARQYDGTGLKYTRSTSAILTLGNNTNRGTSGAAYGVIRLYGTGTYYGDLLPGVSGSGAVSSNSLTANRTWTMPNDSGTVALTSDVPTKTSDLTNDSGFLTSYTETDPTVPSWAKASTKPSYSASEISGLLDFFYPVGSYYQTSDSTFNPNTDWGGTWSLLGEGQVLISAGTNYTAGQSYGSNTKSYTPGGSIGDTKLTDENMAHGHGFTQPKTPALTHSGDSGAMSANSSVAGTFKLRRWGQSGSGITGTTGSFSSDSVSETAHCFSSGTTNDGTVQRISLSKDISHTHTINHTHAAANCTDGAVSNLSGASSTRTAHGHTWNGTAATLNVMQASTATYIWHRTA